MWRKYGTELLETTPSRSTGVRTHGWCHSVGNQMVEVTKPNRNTTNVKTAVENANLRGAILLGIESAPLTDCGRLRRPGCKTPLIPTKNKIIYNISQQFQIFTSSFSVHC